MGRTNPTYRNALDREAERWAPFRRALRAERRADFDRLFEHARTYAHAAGYANPADPAEAVVWSVLLAQEAELRELRERLDDVDGGE